MITAEQFRRQYAKTGDKRTKKKTDASKIKTEPRPDLEKMVLVQVDEVDHWIPESNKELIKYYQKQQNEKAIDS